MFWVGTGVLIAGGFIVSKSVNPVMVLFFVCAGVTFLSFSISERMSGMCWQF